MKTWWSHLTERERWIAGTGTILAALLLLYALVWQPFAAELERLRQGVAVQRADLAWMRQAALAVQRLEAPAAHPAAQTSPGGGRSLLTLVDQTARTAGLGTTVKRVEPQSDGKIRISLEQVSFDSLIGWLNSLERDYGIETANAVMERQPVGGLVDASLVLQEAKP